MEERALVEMVGSFIVLSASGMAVRIACRPAPKPADTCGREKWCVCVHVRVGQCIRVA